MKKVSKRKVIYSFLKFYLTKVQRTSLSLIFIFDGWAQETILKFKLLSFLK